MQFLFLIKKTSFCNNPPGILTETSTIEMQSYGSQSQWTHLQNALSPKARETLQKRGQKDFKNTKFTVRVCLLVTSGSYMLEISPTLLPKHDMKKDNNNRLANADGVKPSKPQPYTKNYRQLKNSESRRNSLPKGRAH